ncbi:hypothetical protein HELRODRAFT_194076 [Helobdella robusta]|uniref:Peptidase metallopeptidase domain-containing protein n=1 Tax=Helobdella robusta TaxID=6412 RepID=T1FVN1_HELRO|nr:hypothetical protein HELRODRAFT_194076 [Helobdella robusta]ESN93570.1 hypothetical protein HELRODRAFT_194076 [Helobdella robusta]
MNTRIRHHPRHISDASEKTARRFDAVSYLEKYGYLPGSDAETQAMRSKQEYMNAIKKLQRFGGIPETGEIDEATRKLMKKSRCGLEDVMKRDQEGSISSPQSFISNGGKLADIPKRYQLGSSKWEKRWLTYRILDFSPDLDAEIQRQTMKEAFEMWSDVTPLQFTEVSTGQADIFIKFPSRVHDDGFPFDGPGNTLAHAFFPGDDRGGDVHFDDDEHWTIDGGNGTDLLVVAVHEIGHSLGIGHSGMEEAIMFPWYSGYDGNLKLNDDDVMAIQELYGAKSDGSSWSKATKRATTVRPRTTTRVHHHQHHQFGEKADETCEQTFDAIANLRNEIFFFVGKKHHRIFNFGEIFYPSLDVASFFVDLPPTYEKVDAVVETRDGLKLFVFIGKRYWLMNGNRLEGRCPTEGYPLTNLGISEEVTHMDAGFVWSYNQRTYFVSGYQYWRLNETTMMVDYGYPRDMNLWEGVKIPVDDAFTNPERNKTYFVHGHDVWEFNDMRMRIRPESKRNLNQFVFGCPESLLKENEPTESDAVQTYRDRTGDVDYLSSSSTANHNGLISTIQFYSIATICVVKFVRF